MNKYKVEIQKSQTFVVDVLAIDESEASKIGLQKYHEAVNNSTEHYLQTGDTIEDVSCVYDVTNTDDGFNPENINMIHCDNCQKEISEHDAHCENCQHKVN